MHLLLIEDDELLLRSLTDLFARERHVVEIATKGRGGVELALGADGIELLILDINLPDISGIEVCREIRAAGSRIPILMLTARDAVSDRIDGLDAGADDYLVKPFAYSELAARIRALMRRTGQRDPQEVTRVSFGPIVLDEAARQVTIQGRAVELSQREFALLECLLRHPRQALSRDQLLNHAWPLGAEVGPNSVDAYVFLLRRKLGAEAGRLIHSVRGIGYRLSEI